MSALLRMAPLPSQIPDIGPFKLSDRVFAHGCAGTIVGNITTGEYAPAQQSRAWGALGAGLLVQWDDGTLTHYREPKIALRHRPKSLG